MTASRAPSSVTPALDPIEAWITEHPWTGPAPVTAPGDRTEASRAAWLRGDAIGAYCVNRSAFELLHALEGTAPLREVDPDPQQARRHRLRLTSTLDAWTLARREHEAGRRSSPVFAILHTSSVAPAPNQRRRHLTPEQRAGQRHRYKGAMADALDAFGRQHLRRDPRAGLYRPRWLDHRHDCRSGYGEGRRTCGGCARIPLPPAPRWKRSRPRARKRDHLTVPEWLLDRAAAARSCQDVVGLQDSVCAGVVVVPQSCHVRAEPDCEAARQARVVGKYREAVEQLAPDRARFVTLTLRNAPRDRLAGGIVDLQAAAEKLRRRALWRGGRCRDRQRCRQPWDPAKRGWRIPHEPVTAHMTTLEITWNADALSWHPHLHSLIESPWIDQHELSESWAELSGAEVVWIASVREHAAKRHQGKVEPALRELLKYAAKPHPAFLDGRDPAVVAELLVALRGRHLMSTGGKLYGLGLEDDPDDERDLVLVWPDTEGAERPYHAPRLCPHHGGPGDWRVLRGSLRRRDCTAAPDLSRPGRSILTWRPPAVPEGHNMATSPSEHGMP